MKTTIGQPRISGYLLRNAVLVFDTAKLVADPTHARIASVPVGTAPVPIVLIDQGRKIVIGNSNRFGSPSESSVLTVIDAGRPAEGPGAVLGTMPAGAFPRELRLSPDGQILYLTNFFSRTLQVIRVGAMPF